MNIFFLDQNPKCCSIYHCDVHASKMILESAQLLCTTCWEHGIEAPYRSTHKNHGSRLWLSQSRSNWDWLIEMSTYLGEEHEYRKGTYHKSRKVIDWCSKNRPKDLPDIGMTPIYKAIDKMDTKYVVNCPVETYRNYYNHYKYWYMHSPMKWTKRNKPEWFIHEN